MAVGVRERASRVVERVDRVQRRRRPLGFVVAVAKKFSDDRAGQLAALIAYYSFFSVFPLMLLLVTVLGYVFHGHPELQKDIAGSALEQIPVVSDGLTTGTLAGHGAGLAVGLFGALWAGTSAMVAGQNAMNAVWDVPIHDRPNFFLAKLRALIMLGVLGLGLIGATVVNAIAASIEGLDVFTQIGVALGNVALNIVVVGFAFQTLTDRRLTLQQILPGAVIAGIAYYGFQTLGTRLVATRINEASDTYGTFATVIGLLTYFYVLAQVTLFAAEVNVVRDLRLYPRSIHGDDLTEADRRAHEIFEREARRRALDEDEADRDEDDRDEGDQDEG
ncbi:MAG: YihY/virulence factor BrkB family protein [Ilumatobacteraceae bacterium]